MTSNLQSEYAKLNQIRDNFHRFSAIRKGDTLLIQANHTVINMKFPIKHFTFSIFSTIR